MNPLVKLCLDKADELHTPTQEPKTTPTPWHLHDMEFGIICSPKGLAIVNCKNSNYSSESQQANAAYIVKCVNERDGLISASKAILKEIYESQMMLHHTETLQKAIAKADGK